MMIYDADINIHILFLNKKNCYFGPILRGREVESDFYTDCLLLSPP